jgi:hypothetical protein
MRTRSGLVIGLAAIGWIAAPGPARADQWTVEKAGFNLYQISGQNVFMRTEGCDDAPGSGVVNVQKDGNGRKLTFTASAASCTVRDFLVPAKVAWDQYSVRLTQDQGRDWYRVSDSDLYLKTVGCVNRSISDLAVLDLNSDGRGWVRFTDGRRCGIEHAFKRFNP